MDTDTRHPRPLRRDAARNRALVVQASLEVFGEFGSLGTVEQVADRAGVGRATVYRSFPTREALLSAIGVHQIAELADIARSCQAGAHQPGMAFVDYVYAFFEYSRANRLYLELFRAEMAAEVAAARDETRVLLSALIEQARQAGLVHPDVVDDDFILLTTGLAVQITLDPTSSLDRWLRAPGLVLIALGVPREIALR
jgi:AcrR family transcriptional regulator